MKLSRRHVLAAAGLTSASLALTPMRARVDVADWRADMLSTPSAVRCARG